MEYQRTQFDEGAAILGMTQELSGPMHLSNRSDIYSVICTSPKYAEDFPATLPLNYTIPAENIHCWTLPIASFDDPGSDFTTSPASTATHGAFSSQINDGYNPFDAGFGQVVCSDTQQQLSYDFSRSQIPLQTANMVWTPPSSAFTLSPDPMPPKIGGIHTPKPNGCIEENFGKLIQRGLVDNLQAPPLSLERPRKRHKAVMSENPIQNKKELLTQFDTLQDTTNPQPEFHLVPGKITSADRIKRTSASKEGQDVLKPSEPASGKQLLSTEKERHRHVEMKYRKQMKDRFEELLLALSSQVENIDRDGRSGIIVQKKMRRGKVLDLAKERIDLLEREKDYLEREQQLLQHKAKVYGDAYFGATGFPAGIR